MRWGTPSSLGDIWWPALRLEDADPAQSKGSRQGLVVARGISIPRSLSRPHPPLCLRPGHGASPSSRVSIAPPARPPAILTMSDTGPIPVLVSSAELTRTFGVLLIGFIFSVVLYGLTFFRASSIDSSRAFASHPASETYIYFTRFPSDHFATKAVVSGPSSRVRDPRPHS